MSDKTVPDIEHRLSSCESKIDIIYQRLVEFSQKESMVFLEVEKMQSILKQIMQPDNKITKDLEEQKQVREGIFRSINKALFKDGESNLYIINKR